PVAASAPQPRTPSSSIACTARSRPAWRETGAPTTADAPRRLAREPGRVPGFSRHHILRFDRRVAWLPREGLADGGLDRLRESLHAAPGRRSGAEPAQGKRRVRILDHEHRGPAVVHLGMIG